MVFLLREHLPAEMKKPPAFWAGGLVCLVGNVWFQLPGLPNREGAYRLSKGGCSGFTIKPCYRCGTAPDFPNWITGLSPLCATHPGGWRTFLNVCVYAANLSFF